MNKLLISVFFILLFSCKFNKKEILNKNTIIEVVEKEFNFGVITLKDTIYHTFKIKNMTDVPFKIDEVGTSCGCTTTNYSTGNIKKGDFAEIETVFIPNKKQSGKIKKSIVVECNNSSGFTTFYITGEVLLD